MNVSDKKLDIINTKSFNCAGYINPATYITEKYMIDPRSGQPFEGDRLAAASRTTAEVMVMGEELSKAKNIGIGIGIGIGVVFIGKKVYKWFKKKHNEYCEDVEKAVEEA